MNICIYSHINPGTGLFFSFKTTVVLGKTSDIFDCIFDGKIEGKMRY